MSLHLRQTHQQKSPTITSPATPTTSSASESPTPVGSAPGARGTPAPPRSFRRTFRCQPFPVAPRILPRDRHHAVAYIVRGDTGGRLERAILAFQSPSRRGRHSFAFWPAVLALFSGFSPNDHMPGLLKGGTEPRLIRVRVARPIQLAEKDIQFPARHAVTPGSAAMSASQRPSSSRKYSIASEKPVGDFGMSPSCQHLLIAGRCNSRVEGVPRQKWRRPAHR